MKASLKVKLLRSMSPDCQELPDIDLLRAYIRQELIIYRESLKQYRQALADRKRDKHHALTPQPTEPFISQTVTQAIDELLRCEKTSLPRLTFQLFMLTLDVEDMENFQNNSQLFPFGFDPVRHLN